MVSATGRIKQMQGELGGCILNRVLEGRWREARDQARGASGGFWGVCNAPGTGSCIKTWIQHVVFVFLESKFISSEM